MTTLAKKISKILNKPQDSTEVQEYMAIFQKHSPCIIHDLGFDPISMHVKCFACGKRVAQHDVAKYGRQALIDVFGEETVRLIGKGVKTQSMQPVGTRMTDEVRAEYHKWYIANMLKARR
jgi:hypothetical protein